MGTVAKKRGTSGRQKRMGLQCKEEMKQNVEREEKSVLWFWGKDSAFLGESWLLNPVLGENQHSRIFRNNLLSLTFVIFRNFE